MGSGVEFVQIEDVLVPASGGSFSATIPLLLRALMSFHSSRGDSTVK